MIRNLSRRSGLTRNSALSIKVPPLAAEYIYFAVVFYAIMAVALGVSVGMLGAGMLALLAVFCLVQLRRQVSILYRPLVFAVCCATSLLLTQIVVHGEGLMDNRQWVTWILGLIVVQSLALRPGFLNRFAVAALVIGLTTLPYLKFQGGAGVGVERAGLDRTVGLANPNDLANYFGFCALYFIILGIETKRIAVRTMVWVVSLGCLFVVGLTVSRGTLLAVALSATLACRRVLKQGFVPLLCLLLFSWIAYQSGLFDQSVAFYLERGDQETGRFLIWPHAIERFFDSPITGVGNSQILTYVPERRASYMPHNTFIYIALLSGVLPFLFFVAFWIRAGRGALFSKDSMSTERPFRLPLFLYLSLASLAGDGAFMYPWGLVTIATTMIGAIPYTKRRKVPVTSASLQRQTDGKGAYKESRRGSRLLR